MADWVIIVDDDETNLKLAGRILSAKGMRVTAFKSGQSLLSYMQSNDVPDLILLDIKMPEMDGFETLERLHQIERAKDVPVIFLTGDENKGAETRGLSVGAMDFIKKPFVPEVLNLRVRHIIDLDHLQKQLANEVVKKTEEANTDGMTGLLNKKASEAAIEEAMTKWDGTLMMIDLDSFKLVNDLYGHEMGDNILTGFAKILRSQMRDGDIAGRIGGDEFIAYCRHVHEEFVIRRKVEYFNKALLDMAKSYMGEDMTIPLGVSVGAARVPDDGCDYRNIRKNADEALYQVKQDGKHGYSVYRDREEPEAGERSNGLNTIEMLFAERNIAKGAIRASVEQFRTIYRYMMRFNNTYAYEIRLVEFDLKAAEGAELQGVAERFAETAAGVLRSSDVVLCHSADKVLAILPKVDDENLTIPTRRVLDEWQRNGDPDVTVTYISKSFM